MFTYEELFPISIMTKVTRKDEEIANNEEREFLFWYDDVCGDGHHDDDLQFDY